MKKAIIIFILCISSIYFMQKKADETTNLSLIEQQPLEMQLYIIGELGGSFDEAIQAIKKLRATNKFFYALVNDNADFIYKLLATRFNYNPMYVAAQFGIGTTRNSLGREIPYRTLLKDWSLKGRVLLASVMSNSYQEVKDELQQGADVNYQDQDGVTVLIYAARTGNTAIAKLLLEKGATLNLQKKDGWTALMMAVLTNHPEVVQLLLEAGADRDITSEKNKTALDYAKARNHTTIIEMFAKKKESK